LISLSADSPADFAGITGSVPQPDISRSCFVGAAILLLRLPLLAPACADRDFGNSRERVMRFFLFASTDFQITPKAFHHSAQGWREERAPTLGIKKNASNPEGVESDSPWHSLDDRIELELIAAAT
jgi:hypothetical protein